MTYLICDQYRLADLTRQDTTAETVSEAKTAAEAMARKYGCRVYVIGVVGEVEGQVSPHWAKDPEPPPAAGWYGIGLAMP